MGQVIFVLTGNAGFICNKAPVSIVSLGGMREKPEGGSGSKGAEEGAEGDETRPKCENLGEWNSLRERQLRGCGCLKSREERSRRGACSGRRVPELCRV